MDKATLIQQARLLHARLIEAKVKIPYTNALDLVAAAHNLPNRHLIATVGNATSETPNLAMIRAIATRLRKGGDTSIETITDLTAAVTHPTAAEPLLFSLPSKSYSRTPTPILIKPADLADAETFVDSESGKALIAQIVEDSYFSAYYRSGPSDFLDNHQSNKLGDEMLKAIDDDNHPDMALYEFYTGESAHEYLHHNLDIDAIVDGLEVLAEEAGVPRASKCSDWDTQLRDRLCEQLEEKDDSSPRDMLSGERAEVVFMFGNPDLAWEDLAHSFHTVYPDAAELIVDETLQIALNSLGYSIDTFRKATGNKHRDKKLKPSRPRRAPIIDEKILREIVAESSTSYFTFVWYGMVKLTDLLELDKTSDLILENGSIATYNPMSGTFYDGKHIDKLTVSRKEGCLHGCHGWYTPDDICGLVHSYYEASIKLATKE